MSENRKRLEQQYESAKKAYHAAGAKARGTQPGSRERQLYQRAKENFKKAGKALGNKKKA